MALKEAMFAKAAALVVLVAAGYAIYYAVQLRMFVYGTPGAGLFPLIAGLGLGLSALLWLAQLVRAPDAEPAQAMTRAGFLRLALQVLALIAFALLLQHVGYIAAALMLVVATALIAGERNVLWIAIVAMIAAFGIQAGFRLLGAPI